jgi:hypothetical protein
MTVVTGELVHQNVRFNSEVQMANIQQRPDVRAITIAIVGDQAEARRIKGRLKLEGIDCVLTAERSLATNKPTKRVSGAVKIQVRRSEVQRALSILGAKNNTGTGNVAAEVSAPPIRKLRVHRLDARNRSVQAVVVLLILLAALILYLF